MPRGLLPLLLVCAVLAGCTQTAVPTSPPSRRTPTPSVSATSPHPEPPPSPTPSPTAPTVPPATAALNVSGHRQVDFASPSGGIWCGMAADYALCHIPFDGYRGKVPTTEQICPEQQLDVTGVNVTKEGVSWFCSGDPSTMPVKGSSQVSWRNGTGFPFVSYQGQTLATLPYGKALRHGRYLCRSERTGMTCADLTTGRGFRVARGGITLF